MWLCNNYNAQGLEAEVSRVQKFLIDNMDVMHNVYPIVSKYFLQKRGLNISTFTRRKVGAFTPSVTNEIETLFANYKQLQSDLDLRIAI